MCHFTFDPKTVPNQYGVGQFARSGLPDWADCPVIVHMTLSNLVCFVDDSALMILDRICKFSHRIPYPPPTSRAELGLKSGVPSVPNVPLGQEPRRPTKQTKATNWPGKAASSNIEHLPCANSGFPVRVPPFSMRQVCFSIAAFAYFPRQHFLCFLPLPQGQSSLRPILTVGGGRGVEVRL